MNLSELTSFTTVELIYVIAALGLYIPMSMKQLDVGMAGYFSLGGYASSILTLQYGVPFPLALAAGTLAGAAAAFVVDALATRVGLAGFAYAIFTLGFAESLRIFLDNLDAVGGAGGLSGMPPDTTLGIVAIVLVLVLAWFVWLDRSPLGQIKTAIADDEFITPIFGIRLTLAKLTLFALGGGLGGLAGGLYAHYVLFLRPDDFGFQFLIALQLPIVFGGLDRFYGAVAGMLLLGYLPEFVRALDQYRLIFTAGATLLVLVVRPSGLITNDLVDRAAAWFRRRPAPAGGDGAA